MSYWSSVQDEFEKFGLVTDVYNTGKGYAFVTFDRKEDAETATMSMDGQTLGGQQIKVRGEYLSGNFPVVCVCVPLSEWGRGHRTAAKDHINIPFIH